jgi:2-desacetyl-2-hydroxyethyl bacteriochlorophyllide A dehydrogenase
MPEWLLRLLGATYSRVPDSLRPAAKGAFKWGLVRSEAASKRRSVERGQRVEFLDFEIAHLEPFEFVGPGPDEALVQSECSTVSPGTERAVLCGLPGARRAFPYTPGYSTAGTVVRAGQALRGIKAGDRVVGRMSHASRGLMTPTSLFKVPDGVSAVEASFLELGIICLQGIRKAGIRPGDRVAVVGQGLIGQLAVRLARLVGADPLIAVASSRRRMKSAIGTAAADEFIALAEDPSALGRLEADVVIEAVGSAKAIVQAMEGARPGGTVVLLGSSRDLGRHIDWWTVAQQRQLRLVGAHISALPSRDASLGRWTYHQEGRLFLDLLASHRLNVEDLVTWRAAPGQCNQVYEVLADGGREHVGIVFDWARLGSNGGKDNVEVG